MHRIVSLSPLPAEFFASLLGGRGITDVEVVGVHGKSREDILKELGRADIIIGDYSFRHPIDRETVTAMRSVKLIQQPSVGYQHIDIQACREAGIRVANTAGANTIAVAAHAICAAMSLLKNVFLAARTTVRGEWNQLTVRPQELSGKTWGIVGMGRIGQALARRLIPFGVAILYYDPFRLPAESERSLGAGYAALDELLRNSDIISLHCPMSRETEGLIGRESIAAMKPTALLVNVARGEVVDEEALADALRAGKIAGAALDVFAGEPIAPDSPFLPMDGDRVLLTPHVAGVTIESQMRIIAMSIENVAAVIPGREPESIIE